MSNTDMYSIPRHNQIQRVSVLHCPIFIKIDIKHLSPPSITTIIDNERIVIRFVNAFYENENLNYGGTIMGVL